MDNDKNNKDKKEKNTLKNLFSKENLKKTADLIKQKTGISDDDINKLKSFSKNIAGKINGASKDLMGKTSELIKKTDETVSQMTGAENIDIAEKSVNKNSNAGEDIGLLFKNIISKNSLNKTKGAGIRFLGFLSGAVAVILLIIPALLLIGFVSNIIILKYVSINPAALIVFVIFLIHAFIFI